MSEICLKERRVYNKDIISALHDDLLLHILSLIPTKQSANTTLLSKRWRFLWTMVPKLDYTENDKDEKSIWDFLDKSMQLHKAPLLKSLRIQLGQKCPVDADVVKWISNAVDRCVRNLNLDFNFANNTSLPNSIYNCKTLVYLTLSHKILVDVPSPARLPSLQSLYLNSVVYKDQDSHVRLTYIDYRNEEGSGRSLVIDSPALRYLRIFDPSGDYRSIQKNTPHLDVALVDVVPSVGFHPNDKFRRSFFLRQASTFDLDRESWLEPLMLFLHNSPLLKVLKIDSYYYNDIAPLPWKEPSSVPRCLLSHLEIFEWNAYRGSSEENHFLAYILQTSGCLNKVGILPRFSYSNKEICLVRGE
ncbi:unnamed protein product [Microthlaspi erraticum]|uniref:FBD domain-containing protein n=1 Tax=Microthlaspi erraticum TaxID=1685480 RepID=A0A6D2L6B2_9BRAS|nr:unnamed protein product [Microthlaspi erraticum]